MLTLPDSARLVLPRLLLKSDPGTGAKIANQAGFAFYGNPPRWHKVTADKPAPKGAPLAAHPEAAGKHAPADHLAATEWQALKLPDSNVNAPSYNKALDKLKEWSDAGNVTAIVGAGYGTNTYASKLVKVANHLLALHGSTHTVAPGQKAGTHAAVLGAPAAAPAPSDLDSPEDMATNFKDGKPAPAPATAADAFAGMKLPGDVKEYLLKPSVTMKDGSTISAKDYVDGLLADGYGDPEYFAAAKGSQAGFLTKPGKPKVTLNDKQMFYADAAFLAAKKAKKAATAPEAQPEPAASAPTLPMPDFQEGKTTTGVKALYEKTAQKLIDLAAAGDFAGLQAMADPAKKMWQGKTPNSKKLVDLHKQAIAAHVAKKDAALGHALAHLKDDAKQGDLPEHEQAEDNALVEKLEAAAPDHSAHDTPASKVLHVIPASDPKAGYEVHVATPKSNPGSKFSVAIKDTDSGEFLPSVKMFPKESDALEHAHALAEGKKPGAKADATTDPGAYSVGAKVKVSSDLQTEHAGMSGVVTKVTTYGSGDTHYKVKLEDGSHESFQHGELERNSGPKEGDTKPAADGGTLVLKDGHWVKQGGDAPTVVGLSPEEIPAIETYTGLGKKTVAEANAAALSGDMDGLKRIIKDIDQPGDETYKPLVHAKKLLALLKAKAAGGAIAVASKGDVFKLDSQYEKMNAGEWVVYNVSPDGQQVYMHKVGAKVPNQTNSATIPASTLAEAIAKGTAKKQDAPSPAAPAPATGNLSAQQLQNLQSIPWFKQKLPPENTNAKSHNAAVAKIEAMAFAGDTAGLQAFIDSKSGAKQTYAKKQALLAQTALAGLQVPGATAATPVEPAPAADPYPLVNEWKSAIVAGKVPTKAQAEAYDALGDTDPDAQKEYFLDAVSASIPSSVPNHGDEFDAAYTAANDKVHELHGHALAGTKPARALKTSSASADLNSIGQQKAEKKAATIKAVEALGLGVQESATKGLLLAGNKGGMAKTYANETQAVAAATKLVQSGIDASVIGTHPYFVKVHGMLPVAPAPAAPAAPAKVKVDAPLYENTIDGHNKFWAVSTMGPVLKTTYGKIGTKGQETVKTFPTEQAAKDAALKLMNEKKGKGYNYAGFVVHEHDAPAGSMDQGPKEGDTKQGADGMLVLKNGHWVKVGQGQPGDDGGWSYDPSDMAMSGAQTLTFEKDGDTHYIAKTDEGYQVGSFDADGNPLEHEDHAFLSDAVAFLKKNGMAPPESALKKLDPSYKASPAKIKKLTQSEIDAAIQKITPGQLKFSTNAASKLALAAAKKGDGPGMAAAYAKAQALSFPKTASHIKAVAEFMGVDTSSWGGGSTPAPAPAASTAAPVSAGGLPSMDAWVQTGPQKGSNPGGKFKDQDGNEWYCKWPDDAEAAKSEVLAAKLYALAGLSSQDCMLVSKGGKTAIATKWVNIKKGSPAELAAADGALSGFAVDAWLGNWDVVGLSYDNLQIGPDGKAHRVDAGGSLEYRAQGEKKPFGSKVEELDTLRDAKKNDKAASVFGKMTDADIAASVAKVAAISDVAIRAMVNQYGPGEADAKKKLADTLIARKQDLLKKYPQAAKAKKKHVFKPEKISAPPSFLNWGGSGKSGPSSKEFLNKANEDAVQAIFAAAKTGNLDAVKNLTAPVFDKDSGQVTGHKPVLEHPSQHVKGYAQQVINEINYQLNPPKRFRFDGGHPLHALNNAYPSHKGAKSSAAAQKLGKFLVLGEPGTIKLEDAGLPEKIKHAEGGGPLSQQTYKPHSHAAWHKMPKTQQDAIQAYTGSSYHKMNGSLWDGNPTGAAKAAAEALHTLGHDIAPGTVLSRKLSIHGSDLQARLGAKGKILQEPAIMSTAIRPSSWSGNVQLKLHVGPGVKGLWVGPGSKPGGGAISVNSGEDEMLLPPNTRLLILSSTAPTNSKDGDGFGGSGMHVIEAVVLPTM